MKREKISIVVSCYNEEASLPYFYKEISKLAKQMKEIDFEFMFVNDGSKDKTLKLIKDLANESKYDDIDN